MITVIMLLVFVVVCIDRFGDHCGNNSNIFSLVADSVGLAVSSLSSQ